jgi:Zn finger protein HypA/HybF involved in hydrogenase expression
MIALTLHDVAVSTTPIGVECEHCMRHALLTREIARARAGDFRTLEEAGLHCGKCGSRNFNVMRLDKSSRRAAFMRNL